MKWEFKNGQRDQIAGVLSHQETSLRHMYEGLQLHRALLSSISPRLENKEKVTELLADIRDLVIQINKVVEYFHITVFFFLRNNPYFEAPCWCCSMCLADAENGPNWGCGAAHTDPCGLTSAGGVWGSGGSSPDSGAAPVLWAGHGPLPQESGPDQWGGDRELTNMNIVIFWLLLADVQNVTISCHFLLWHLFIFLLNYYLLLFVSISIYIFIYGIVIFI